MEVLAISGSLRPNSSNAALLMAVRRLVPEVKWNDFSVGHLPFFDPSLQFGINVPPLVRSFRDVAQRADIVVIATPEYAHGIPGVLKNALEWLICEETMQKEVIVFIVSPGGGEHVKEYLLETLGRWIGKHLYRTHSSSVRPGKIF